MTHPHCACSVRCNSGILSNFNAGNFLMGFQFTRCAIGAYQLQAVFLSLPFSEMSVS